MKNLRELKDNVTTKEDAMEFAFFLKNIGWSERRIARYLDSEKHPLHSSHFGTFSPIKHFKEKKKNNE